MTSSPNRPSPTSAIPNPEALAALPEDGGPEFNRLVFEASPYLQQHARNPVDWHPWSEESFDKARAANKPVFLSIGYATCHWCHVMERESFEDVEVAALINEFFVPIKVDREERPDIDHVYMTVCQVATGSGGWPLTAFLDHDKHVFFVGTYFPKHGGFNRPGLMELLPRAAEVWRTHRKNLHDTAKNLNAQLQHLNRQGPGTDLTDAVLHQSFDMLASAHDARHGGFGGPPKFPTPQNLRFLLRFARRTGQASATDMATRTLLAMRRGGIYDHLGFGFHRYATDSQWLVPHFEKMLYDQALITQAYVDGFLATGDPRFAQTAREILAYVSRDLTAPEGGFYSAEDADSEGEEGKFYVWTEEELEEHLDAESAATAKTLFNTRPEGNYAEESTGRKTGRNILHRRGRLDAQAEALGLSRSALVEHIDGIRRTLFAVRKQRIHPFKDDKILTDWNGLMISAFARAGRALQDPTYIDQARRAAEFVMTRLRDPQGRLLKRSRGSQVGLPAHLDDYAFLVAGLLDLYEAAFDCRDLQAAVTLTRHALEFFWDAADGGFFLTASDGEALILRSKTCHDGASPSGNSVFAMNLVRLFRMTGGQEWADRADQLFRAFSSQVTRSPANFNDLLCALDAYLSPGLEIVVSGAPKDAAVSAMLQAIASRFLPHGVVLFRPDGPDHEILAELAPFTKHQTPIDGRAAAYVCRDFACHAPVTEFDDLEALLDASEPAPK